jgi:hypothetical protein
VLLSSNLKFLPQNISGLVQSRTACVVATTRLQPEPYAEPKSAVSA